MPQKMKAGQLAAAPFLDNRVLVIGLRNSFFVPRGLMPEPAMRSREPTSHLHPLSGADPPLRRGDCGYPRDMGCCRRVRTRWVTSLVTVSLLSCGNGGS